MAMEEKMTVFASDKHYTVRVIERKDLSEDLWSIRVDPGGPFQFKAGHKQRWAFQTRANL
jgi:hypothetical protein